MFKQVYGFDIIPVDGGYRLIDTHEWNNWGEINHTFDTQEAAEDYALRCHLFKTGRISSL